MSRLKIRQFRLDCDNIAVLQRIAKTSGNFTLKDLKNIKAAAFKDHCYLAEVNSRPAGFIVFRAKKASGRIEFLAVNPRFQGSGLGARLLRRAEGHIKTHKAKRVFLHTFGFSGNYFPFYKVREFYYRNGFQRLREIPNGFVNGVDKLIMVKEFA